MFLMSELPAQWSLLSAEADLLLGAVSPLSLASKDWLGDGKGCAWLMTHFLLNSQLCTVICMSSVFLPHPPASSSNNTPYYFRYFAGCSKQKCQASRHTPCRIYLTMPVEVTYIDLRYNMFLSKERHITNCRLTESAPQYPSCQK